ncbi:Glutamine-binding periplasmic protein [Moorella thermoacetica]|uniref:Glutamine-binding periplasmic protein n=2 Tax=Neomoorella thermoacetica TaxID=1525 RepID=A0A1D7XA64_NEOTH|nr:basic amino acid ABC transporter substrate-binding protein [Moorella thermoacetica]AOQ23808.1 Glutamine-binding periplasmic protein precursor [Moorella thermoacetica]OIQ08907.1 glutamine-binding periplasmic protein precursor [Moorella thermoacetica]OIQ12781.1 glutamine-binding periplasmic protein precursor [Moorella thermoacetica]OIQ61669.1 glutamine-binding periplasmic protein precursor [Moorella thermoacetica]TYL13993.1 Glutamine-binding periplasmic protein [Moorella thermoacetica]
MRGWQKIGGVLLLMLLLAGLTGCGGSNPQGNGAGAGTQANSSNTSTGKPRYSVALEATFAPFEFRDMKTGEFTGFDIDLIKAIGQVEGFDVDIKEMGFDGIITALQTNNVDLAISGISIDDERKKAVDFSLPYYQSGLVVAVKADNNTIKGFDDLKGKKIAVQINTTSAKEAKKIPGAMVTELDKVPDMFLELKNGGVDAVVNDLPVTAYYIKQGNNDVKIVGDIRSAEYYGIAVPKGKTEILQKINDGLKALKANGQYEELYKKWFGQEPPAFLPGEPPQQKS